MIWVFPKDMSGACRYNFHTFWIWISILIEELQFTLFYDFYFNMWQISEVVNSMKDLIDFCREQKAGPIGKILFVAGVIPICVFYPILEGFFRIEFCYAVQCFLKFNILWLRKIGVFWLLLFFLPLLFAMICVVIFFILKGCLLLIYLPYLLLGIFLLRFFWCLHSTWRSLPRMNFIRNWPCLVSILLYNPYYFSS